ncbi:MAG: M23 family metallopeptidase [Oscillospiraceae bacterium]|nr:M23 family metallopeptidase [Oscillospiraceae bacterium]
MPLRSSGSLQRLRQLPLSNSYTYPTDASHRRLSRGFTGVNDHRGIDIIGAAGTPIYAFADGIVAFRQDYNANIYPNGDSNSMQSMGNLLCINHYNPDTSIAAGSYVQTVYMHMSSIAVSQGATVKKGQVIGYIGNTGYSSGAHLHFNIGVGSRDSMKPGYSGYTSMGSIGVIDPLRYLPGYYW